MSKHVILALVATLSRVMGDSFIHIPRTGGIAFRMQNTKMKLNVWHSARKPPPVCGYTILRNESDRYCSEWQFYGKRFLRKGRAVKGWRLKKVPASFADFVSDPSTHNTQLKILSGCNLYASDCVVNETTVEIVLRKIYSGCLKNTLSCAECKMHRE